MRGACILTWTEDRYAPDCSTENICRWRQQHAGRTTYTHGLRGVHTGPCTRFFLRGIDLQAKQLSSTIFSPPDCNCSCSSFSAGDGPRVKTSQHDQQHRINRFRFRKFPQCNWSAQNASCIHAKRRLLWIQGRIQGSALSPQEINSPQMLCSRCTSFCLLFLSGAGTPVAIPWIHLWASHCMRWSRVENWDFSVHIPHPALTSLWF